MKFYINENFDGSVQEFSTKAGFIHVLASMIDDCLANGGTIFNITVDTDATCFNTEV